MELSRSCLMKKIGQIIGLIYVDRQHKTNVLDQIKNYLGDDILVMSQKVLVSANHENVSESQGDIQYFMKQKEAASHNIKEKRQNQYLTLFPEGTTGASDVLMKFKIGTFTLRRKMQPITLKYLSFWPVQATVGVKNIFWIMMNPITIIKVSYLDPVIPQSWETAQEFCQRVNTEMANNLNTQVSKYGLNDFLWFIEKETHGEVQLQQDNFVTINQYKQICKKNCQNWHYQHPITKII